MVWCGALCVCEKGYGCLCACSSMCVLICIILALIPGREANTQQGRQEEWKGNGWVTYKRPSVRVKRLARDGKVVHLAGAAPAPVAARAGQVVPRPGCFALDGRRLCRAACQPANSSQPTNHSFRCLSLCRSDLRNEKKGPLRSSTSSRETTIRGNQVNHTGRYTPLSLTTKAHAPRSQTMSATEHTQ